MYFTAQSDLFEASRWPRRPYCSDDLASGLRVRSLRQAIEKPYLQANPPHLRVWSIYDVDRPGAALAWEAANLLPPSWAAVNRENAHAHLVYGIRAPVLVEGLGARDAPLRYLCAVEALTRERLQADSGYGGLITKNPTHPLWRTLYGPCLAYELAELAEYLPDLEKYRPKRRRPEEIGIGRNVALFDTLRQWAYRHVRPYKGGGLAGWNAWLSLTNSTALLRNADFLQPLDGREVWHVAKSVAKWTYQRFDVEASDKRFSALQSFRRTSKGRKSIVDTYRNDV